MQKNKKGFSLLETVLYVFLMASILSVLAFFLLQLTTARTKTRTISEVLIAGELIEQRLSEAVRHAQALRIGSSVFGTDPGVLSLDMVDALRDPINFSLTVDNGQFQVSEGTGGAAVPLTSSNLQITNLVFTNLTGAADVGIIQVQFTVQATSSSGSRAFTYDQAFQTTLRIPLD
jgi:type II secretory pathway pseudopilin PulG